MPTPFKKRILVVDDDEDLSALLAFGLESQGYAATNVGSAKEMFRELQKGGYDLILLDLELPDEDGIALTRKVRARSRIPIVILTGRRDGESQLAALELGADDFVTKPFDPRVVLLRVKNVLQRSSAESDQRSSDPEEVLFQGWKLDLSGRALWSPAGTQVSLTPGEYRILARLARTADRPVSRDQLLDVVADGDDPPSQRMIDVYISQLRSKIEHDRKRPVVIQTAREFGYKLAAKTG